MIGRTLGRYEVTSLLGKGGMGEVYRARDTELGRSVALKLLPESLAQDPERLARFQREARTLASLNHPNVASLFGAEEADGVRFLVMEEVEGEDLAERLERGRLPVDEAIELGCQVARGLASAHEKGIVHRDLKPANIKFTADGQVKILDFGLARPFVADSPEQDLAHSPTITAAMTQAGVVLGTAAYMSPEQAKGRMVDRQSDIFSFGCVLFECLSGTQAFPGDSVTEVLASVLRSEPDWSALPGDIPPHVLRVVRACLAKDRRDRLHDIGDAELLLRTPEPSAAPDGPAPRRGRLWPAIAALLAVALVGAVLWRGAGVPQEPRLAPVRSMSQLTDLPGLQLHPSLSSDGRQLLYTNRDGGDFDIFLQRVGGENAVNLTANSPDQDVQAAFSPDGDRIAFVSDRQGGGIYVMGATGEDPQRMTDRGFDPDWSPDGGHLVYTEEFVVDPYTRSGLARLWTVDLATGETRMLSEMDAAGPSWSPDGTRIAFWTHLATVQGQRDIWTMPAEGGEARPVLIDIHTDWDPVWSADGRWLYFVSDRGGTRDLWRIPIDQATGETQGDPEPVTVGTTGVVQASPPRNGRTAILALSRRGAIQRVAFDPVAERVTGSFVTLRSSAHPLWQMSSSADGRWLTYGTTSPRERLYMLSVDGRTERKLVDDENRNRGLDLAPDGKWGTYYSNSDGHYDIWAVRTDGTGARNLTRSPTSDYNEPVWFVDGRLVATLYGEQTSVVELLIPPGGLDAVEAPLETRPLELPGAPGFSALAESPDGRKYLGTTMPEGSLAVCSLDEQAMVVLERDGKPVRAQGRAVWLDDSRILFWDEVRTQAMVHDLATGEFRPVPDIPGPSHYALSPDRSTLYINRVDESSDIWMLELAVDASPPGS